MKLEEFDDGTVDVTWFPPNAPTPPGGCVWATDGNRVWLIFGNGDCIPSYATRVKAWTHALIPRAPQLPLCDEPIVKWHPFQEMGV